MNCSRASSLRLMRPSAVRATAGFFVGVVLVEGVVLRFLVGVEDLCVDEDAAAARRAAGGDGILDNVRFPVAGSVAKCSALGRLNAGAVAANAVDDVPLLPVPARVTSTRVGSLDAVGFAAVAATFDVCVVAAALRFAASLLDSSANVGSRSDSLRS